MKKTLQCMGGMLLAATLLASGAQAATNYSSLVVFGDSLSDSGNNALHPLVGVDATQVVAGDYYIPRETYGSGVYSNGPVWATQFAAKLGLSANPSLAGGSNFAFGGAETGSGPASLLDQLGLYSATNPSSAAVANTLFVVAGGGNDARSAVSAAFGESDPLVQQAIIGAAAAQTAQNIGSIVNQLQAAGAQHIIVWNVPNLGITPAALFASQVLDPTAAAKATAISAAFNSALQPVLDAEPGVLRYDLFGLLGSVPAGTFSNTTSACGSPLNAAVCTDVATALFWDGIHPTTAAHRVVADQMFALVAAPVPEPSELAMLAAGLVMVVTVVRRRKL